MRYFFPAILRFGVVMLLEGFAYDLVRSPQIKLGLEDIIFVSIITAFGWSLANWIERE